MPEYVYHYTSLDALNGIIKKDKIIFRATKYKYLNDPYEKIWAQHYIESEIDKEIEGTNHNSDIIKKLIDRYPYIISFCDIPDYRNMWRLYCKDGIGVCIGLDSDVLCQIAHHNITFDTKSKQDYFEHVYYCSRGDVSKAFEFWKRTDAFNTNKNDNLDNLYAMSAFIKCDDFDIEHEVRYARMHENNMVTIHQGYSYGDFAIEAKEDLMDVMFRIREPCKRVPFIEVEFPSFVVKKIIVGYGYANVEDAKKCVKQIVSINPLLEKIEIEESKVNKF